MFAETGHDDLGLGVDGDFDGATETGTRVNSHFSELTVLESWHLQLIIWKKLDFKVFILFIAWHCQGSRKRR